MHQNAVRHSTSMRITKLTQSNASDSNSVSVIMLGNPSKKLGGQEIRWGRLLHNLPDYDERKINVVINSSLYHLITLQGFSLDRVNLRIYPDNDNRLLHKVASQLFTWRSIPRHSLIHVTPMGVQSLPSLLLCKYIKRCKLIFSYTGNTIRGLLTDASNPKGFRAIKVFAKESDIFDVLNPSIDWQGIVPEKSLRVAPCSFSSPEKFVPSHIKRRKVVFAGHLSKVKGTEILIDILKSWPKTDETEFLICGDALNNEFGRQAECTIDRICAERGNWRRVRPADISPMLSDAKVFLSLQSSSNYPSQSLLEAMLSGCCVVATDDGETDLLVRAPFGVTIDRKADTSVFVKEIAYYLNLPESTFQTYSTESREFVRSNHTIERYSQYLCSLWDELRPSSTYNTKKKAIDTNAAPINGN